MSRNEIIEQLKTILVSADARNADAAANCTEQSRLTTDLGLTSVGMLYLVIAIEESFGIRFDDVGMGDFTLLSDVVDYIESKLK